MSERKNIDDVMTAKVVSYSLGAIPGRGGQRSGGGEDDRDRVRG